MSCTVDSKFIVNINFEWTTNNITENKANQLNNVHIILLKMKY